MSKQWPQWHFSYKKVVKFGNPHSVTVKHFLTILGYRAISQSQGWWMSRFSVLRQFSRGPFLTVLKRIETNVAHNIFWDMAGRKNKISLLPKVLGLAVETKIRFLSWKTWKDLGICSLLEGCIHLLKSLSGGWGAGGSLNKSTLALPWFSSLALITWSLGLGGQHLSSESTTLSNCRHWT